MVTTVSTTLYSFTKEEREKKESSADRDRVTERKTVYLLKKNETVTQSIGIWFGWHTVNALYSDLQVMNKCLYNMNRFIWKPQARQTDSESAVRVCVCLCVCVWKSFIRFFLPCSRCCVEINLILLFWCIFFGGGLRIYMLYCRDGGVIHFIVRLIHTTHTSKHLLYHRIFWCLPRNHLRIFLSKPKRSQWRIQIDTHTYTVIISKRNRCR